jgi:RimJ/RimL family protein N-acetyltransferase
MNPLSVDRLGPSMLQKDVVLTDGRLVHIRPIRPDDSTTLMEFHSRLSEGTVVYRFLAPHPRLSEREAHSFANVDGIDRVALVAEVCGHMIAVARYERSPGSDRAEVAFVVEDAFQGKGLGSILLQALVVVARRSGIRTFVADTFAENHRMLDVFRDSGLTVDYEHDFDLVRVVMDLCPAPASNGATGERQS